MAFRYEVSLQIWHPSADPDFIVHQIGREADSCHARGNQPRTPKGQLLEGTYPDNYCLFRLGEREDGELATFLEAAVAELTRLKPVFDDLRATGGRIVMGILWWTGPRGEVLPVDLLASIANLGIDLGITPVANS